MGSRCMTCCIWAIVLRIHEAIVDLLLLLRDRPNDRSCWRFSFYYHLKKALESGGFMLQLAEYSPENGTFELGPGQAIETLIAQLVGVKVFRMQINQCFQDRHAAMLSRSVEQWSQRGNGDVDLELIPYNDLV